MSRPLKALVVEDCEGDAELVLRVLTRAGYDVTHERVETGPQMSAALANSEWEIIVSDYRLPRFNAPAALQLLQRTGRDIPFIVVSGTIGENVAVEMMKSGASDYLMKNNLARLAPAVERELGEARSRRERRQAQDEIARGEARHRAILESTKDGFWIADSRGFLLDVNQTYCSMVGYSRDELVQMGIQDLEAQQTQGETEHRIRHIIETGSARFESRHRRKDGRAVDVEVSTTYSPGDQRICAFIRDITERKSEEQENAATLALFSLLNASNDLPELIRSLTTLFQEFAGCDAVGIRLREGSDSFHAQGQVFSTQLATVESHGRRCVLDGVQGNSNCSLPGMACICGDMLDGRIDPNHPCLTAYGSLWANSIKDLLAPTGGDEHQSRISNRCATAGYESIVLVPLKCGGEVYGLLQFADKRPGRFATRFIAHMERSGGSIAATLNQRLTQNALQTSEQRYRLMSENTADVIWLMDVASQRFTYVSAAVSRLRGYAPEQVVDTTLEEALTPESYRRLDAALRARMARFEAGDRSAYSAAEDVDQPRADGSIVPTEVVTTLLAGDSGSVLEILGVSREISERRKAEKALRESEARLALALATSRMGVWEWEFATDNIYWSGQCLEILGQAAQNGKRVSFKDVVHPEDLGGLLSAADRAVAERSTFTHEFRIIGPNADNVRWCSNLGQATYGPDGQPHRLIGTVQDITDRKRAEEERTILEEQLRQAQKLESIGRLAGGIAHDFNNILTVINGYSDLLIEQMGKQDAALPSIHAIRTSGERAAALTRQLLAFSRKQVLNPKPVDLNALITESQDLLGRLVGEDLNITAKLTSSPGRIMADPGQVHQVLMNLAVNARDAMPHGGTITIETSDIVMNPDTATQHPEALPGPYVQLAVSDTGVGISAEIRNRIFDPFFTTKGEGEGTGLGLSTVYRIVRQSGGFIDVQSEVGQGTRFSICWPRIELPVTAERPAASPMSRHAGTETILLVEDQVGVRTLAASVLKGRGYEVLQAGAGDEAMDIITTHPNPIHLIITDVVMPGMDGKELAHRATALRPDTKVLFCSGYPNEVMAREGLIETGVSFLPKPFTPQTLTAKVRELLGPSQASTAE